MPCLFHKLICGNRRTHRLADEKGNPIPLSRIVRNGPKALCSCIGRKLFNLRPAVPWISYDARRTLSELLPSSAVVLEFGSGNSTIWFAKHYGAVDSVEHDALWHAFVSKAIRTHSLNNVSYYLHQEPEYARFAETAGKRYDLIMIDGIVRSACAATALQRVKPDGIIYLDNSDKHPQGGDTRLAEERLLTAAEALQGQILYFTDFAPTDLFANQGMMLLLGRYAGAVCARPKGG